MEKIKISLMVTQATLAQLQRLGEVLVPGVQLDRGAVVAVLAAEKAKAVGLVNGAAGDCAEDKATGEWTLGEL